MADAFFLSVWFPSFAAPEIMPRALSIMRHFPFSAQRPGICHLSVHPVEWQEPTVLERRFYPGLDPQSAVNIAGEFVQEDYAYLFEAYWDLWAPPEEDEEPALLPTQVKFIAHGLQFAEEEYQHAGHLQVDFGLDSPFLYEDEELTPLVAQRFHANVHKLVSFADAVEKNCGITGRILCSESDDNLAQKLIERLQRVQ